MLGAYNRHQQQLQHRQKSLEREEWQRRYSKFTANQCSGDLALVSEDGYYAVPFCAAYAPSGDYALVAGEYGTILKIPTGVEAAPEALFFKDVTDAIFDVEWHPNDREKIVLASSDSRAYVWDLQQNVCVHTVQSTDLLKRAKYYDESLLITGGAAGKLEAWDVRAQANVMSIDAHSINGKGSITTFAFDSDGCIGSIGTPDYRIKTWDLRMPRRPVIQIDSICSQRQRAFTGLDYCPWTSSWYASNTNNRVYRFNDLGVLCDTFQATQFSSISFYTKLRVGLDGQSVMCTSGNGQLHVWNVDSGDCVAMGNGAGEMEVTAFAQCAQRDELLIANEDGSVRLWSPKNDSNERAVLIKHDVQQEPSWMDTENAHFSGEADDFIAWPEDVKEYAQKPRVMTEQALIPEYYGSEQNVKRPRLAK